MRRCVFFVNILAALSFTISVFSLSAVAQNLKPNLSPREIAQNTLPSMVSVVAEKRGSKFARVGSGFFIADDLVVTNYHVVEGFSRGFVKLYDAETKFNITSVVDEDKLNDLVVLRVDGRSRKILELGFSDTVSIGESVFAVGNPQGLEGTFSQGIVSSIRTLSGRKLIQITAAISPGSSGGPVVNERGKVIAIAVGGITKGQSLNFAVPVSFLRAMVPTIEPEGTVHIPYAIENKSLGFSFQAHPGIDKELDYYRGPGRIEMESGLYRSGMFMRMARRIFKEVGVPENVAWLAQIESGWNPESENGLWGFTHENARKRGLVLDSFTDERRSFEEASRAAAAYLRTLYEKYGNWELAIAAYHSGPEIIDTALLKSGSTNFGSALPHLPLTQRDFTPKVLATILIANNPVHYGFGHVRPAAPVTYDRVRLPPSVELSRLAEASETTIQQLNYLNPHLRKDFTPPYPYIVNVPAGMANRIVELIRTAKNWYVRPDAASGETWQTISNRTGISVVDLMAANPGMAKPFGRVSVPVPMLLEAKRLVEKGQDEEAVARLRLVLDADHRNVDAHLILAKIHLRNADLNKAITSLKTAMFWDDSKLIELPVALGRIYVEKGDCLQARTYSSLATEIDPNDSDSKALRTRVERCSK